MQTRKYPRTMNEAFGPYSNGPIFDPSEPPMDWQDVVVGAGCAVALFALVCILVL